MIFVCTCVHVKEPYQTSCKQKRLFNSFYTCVLYVILLVARKSEMLGVVSLSLFMDKVFLQIGSEESPLI
jgi:hypothetical protein